MPTSTRDWRLYADDIVESCGKVRRFISGMDYQAFVADDRTQDAVIRNIEIIGEAAHCLPEKVLAVSPEVDWKAVRGMRELAVNGYFGLDSRVVWSTATNQLDELEAAVRKFLA